MPIAVFLKINDGVVTSTAATIPGGCVFRLPRQLAGALTSPDADQTREAASFKLRLKFSATLEEAFAAWDQLNDEALNDFETSLG